MSVKPSNPPGAMATYLRAEIPRQFTVLGQRLLPFSLWHMELLMRFENGFVTPDQPIGLGDLVQGVYFCCQDYQEGLKALSDPKTDRKLAQWGEAIGLDVCAFKKGKIVFKIEDKALLFAEYLREGSGRPELMPSDGEENRAPGAPLLQLLKLFLVEHLRLSTSQAMNYSFALACHDFFAWHEQRGAAKIANQDEGEMLAEHDEATESAEMLQRCLDALPGSRPIGEETPPKATKETKKSKRLESKRTKGRTPSKGRKG